MSHYFEVESRPGHVGVEFDQASKAALESLKQQAVSAGVGGSTAFDPEVDYLREIVTELREALPAAMTRAGWPEAIRSGDKLDDFILMVLKDLARAARGRGTNASAKLAVAGTDAQ
ncbi:hypothetical protein QYR02_12615 [Microbacterium maritypicum]|uniref:hypothetical protein n=1 Tax=Microbacterium maritypicum TaxID=33918 RepID=UPI002670DB66|nr:hypothetical protein [Microbacterium liquefaciens]WKT88287.1 hypothetical protein QYR02_12615 [Microbacterium liquefaciens]